MPSKAAEPGIENAAAEAEETGPVCKACGAKVKEGAAFCMGCGAKIEQQANPSFFETNVAYTHQRQLLSPEPKIHALLPEQKAR